MNYFMSRIELPHVLLVKSDDCTPLPEIASMLAGSTSPAPELCFQTSLALQLESQKLISAQPKMQYFLALSIP